MPPWAKRSGYLVLSFTHHLARFAHRDLDTPSPVIELSCSRSWQALPVLAIRSAAAFLVEPDRNQASTRFIGTLKEQLI